MTGLTHEKTVELLEAEIKNNHTSKSFEKLFPSEATKNKLDLFLKDI